jgi:3-deoxy-manno-octulosonate cytidylyltransferase (CMP-KDO synthetase)
MKDSASKAGSVMKDSASKAGSVMNDSADGVGSSRVVAVIPSRFASTRLPGKPLSDIHGKPMVQWVYERARAARGLDAVIVATDDERVASAVRKFGGQVAMTAPELPSGTDRVAAVAAKHAADIYVNIQGDEPLMDPRAIEAAVELVRSGRFPMATVMTPLRSAEELANPAVVKVIADRTGRALYFSRHPIPYSRQAAPGPGEPFACRRHVGLYVYARETLRRLTQLPPSPLERGESLEQLRAMEDGIPIGIAEVDFVSIGVDTPEELEKVRRHLGQK